MLIFFIVYINVCKYVFCNKSYFTVGYFSEYEDNLVYSDFILHPK